MSWQNKGGNQNNPWSGGGKRNPWGGGGNNGSGGHGGGPNPPDIDEVLQKMQENLRQMMPGNFGGGRIFGLLLLAVIGLWLASGFYLVQPSEHGVVLTFGEYTRTDEMPGLKYRFPWPIQTVDIVNVTSERRTEIGFRDPTGGRPGAVMALQEVPAESLMLTGDENIIDIHFVVLWRIGDARQYLYEIRDPDDTVKKAAESAMREVIGQIKIQPALTEARGQIQQDTRALLQNMLDDYKSGIAINNVQLLKVDPPAPVVDAFNDVQRARADRERLRNEAEAYRNDVIPRARGEAERLRQQAEAYKAEIMNRASGDGQRFASVLAEYQKAQDVTKRRMYLETMEEILQNAKTVVMDSSVQGSGILPYMPVNEMRRLAPAAGGNKQ